MYMYDYMICTCIYRCILYVIYVQYTYIYIYIMTEEVNDRCWSGAASSAQGWFERAGAGPGCKICGTGAIG